MDTDKPQSSVINSTVAEDFDRDDPYYQRIQRQPFPANTGVSVIVLTKSTATRARAEEIANSIVKLIDADGRPHDQQVEVCENEGISLALTRGLDATTHPIVLVTTAEEPWTDEHFKPLLRVIDFCDHAFGRRRQSWRRRFSQALTRWPWKTLLAVPGVEVESPCRLHRRQALLTLGLRSKSRFAWTELLAKASYLTQVVAETRVPFIRSETCSTAKIWQDVRELWTQPKFGELAQPPSRS